MKIICAVLMFVTLGIFAKAQTPGARLVTEIAASSDRVVKGSPFSAEAISESVQVLADGNRIVRSSTSKLYRNSEGRFRREGSGGMGGLLGSHFEFGPAISIVDPVVGFRYQLNPDSKTGRAMVLTAPEASGGSGVSVVTVPRGEDLAKFKEDIAKYKEEAKAARAAGGGSMSTRELVELAQSESLLAVTRAAPAIAATAAIGAGFAYSAEFSARAGNSRTEQLGVQNIEGVEAEGTRTVTTIEAGKIGNERPIEIVYERWYSKELQLVVVSRHSDPRFGEQTYRLTNINRTEPDPSLFSLPTEYKIQSEPGRIHRVNTTKAATQNVYTRTSSSTASKAAKP